MKRTLLSFTLAAATLGSWAQAPTKFTLEEAISTALTNNFGQQILNVSAKSSAETLAQSKRDLWPDVSASLSHDLTNTNNNGSYSVNASATLWNGAQNINAIRRSQTALEQADTKIAQAQNDLTISVIQSFLSVLMNDELYRYRSEVVKISEEQMKQGEAKYRSGQMLESDYLLLTSQFATDSYNLTNSKSERENALLELKNLLSLAPMSEIGIVTPEVDLSIEAMTIPDLQQLIDRTLAWLPDVKISQQNIALARIDTKIAQGAYQPTLSIGASVGTGYNSLSSGSWGNQFTGNNFQQIGLTLSIPIWNKGKTRSNVKQNRFKLQQAELEARQTDLDIRNSLEKEHLNVVSLREKYLAARTGSNAYEQTFKVFSTQFEKGLISTTELLQQQNNYLSALNEFLQSKYSYLLNRKVLDVYMGEEIKL